MLRREDAALIAGGEHLAGVERHAEVRGMRRHFDLRERDAGRHFRILVLGGAGLAAAVIREAEVHARLVGAVSSPGGWSSPIPSTWLSVNHRLLSFGLKSIPTELRTPQ